MEKVGYSRTGHVACSAACPTKQLRRELSGFQPGEVQLIVLDWLGRGLRRARNGALPPFLLSPVCKLIAAQPCLALVAWKWPSVLLPMPIL